jgi:thiol-disulfide isomerase/thioredoxin
MTMKTHLMISACLALTCFLGCGQPSAPPSPQPSTAAPLSASATGAAPASTPPAEPEKISLEVKSWDDTQQIVAAQKGKVVVLDMWSTWCPPCMREFPNLVKLHRAHAANVVCISFNLDYSGAAGETPESFRVPVNQFLTKQGATFLNVISSDADDDVFRRLKLGSIPAVLVYGRDGRLAKRLDNDDALYGKDGFTYEQQIVPLVEQLLKAASGPPPRG